MLHLRWSVLAALLGMCAAPLAAPDIAVLAAVGSAQSLAPPFRADTRLVEVDVVVHDKAGRPLTDLGRGDFTLYEDGKEQPIELFAVNPDSSLPGSSAAPLTPSASSASALGRASSPIGQTERFMAR